MSYDVILVGGGPAGLSAALTLGRARRRVLLCDSGPRRNARAHQVHNFVTRDGTPPAEFREVARRQLVTYPNVEVRDVAVSRVGGERGAFSVHVGAEVVTAKRILVCTGMIDVLPSISGFEAAWGHCIFQCPYCHGWEVQDRQWGYLLGREGLAHFLPFVSLLRGWTPSVHLFANGLQLPETALETLQSLGVGVSFEAVAAVHGTQQLRSVELVDGSHLPCEILFAHPPQRQVTLVSELGLDLDGDGFVVTDPMTRQTSVPGIYAAGDLTTRMQAAVAASASAMQAAAMINLDLATSR